MQVVIYGASDDLIEVEGDLTEEFSYLGGDDEGAYLAFSDGTLLTISYGAGGSGFWRINRLCAGAANYVKVEATDEDTDYSDRVTLSGDNLRWVVCGTDYVAWKPVPSGTPSAQV